MKMISATYVVVGGGIAGVSCVQQLLRETSSNANIILVSASPAIKVVRNVKKLSRRLDQFDVLEENYTNLSNVRVIVAKMISIDPIQHTLMLSNGIEIKYKKLCLCTGALPKSIDSLNPHVLGIRDTETVKMFRRRLGNAKRIVLVGNGGIAIELVYEIQNCEIVWIIKDSSIGTTFFDVGAAEFLNATTHHHHKPSSAAATTIIKRLQYSCGEESHESMGSSLGPDWSFQTKFEGKGLIKSLKINYECEIEEIFDRHQCTEKWPVYVKLSNGLIYGCDFIVSATGVIPNISFLAASKIMFDLAEDGGIKVDSNFRTNVKDIFAAGDVCTASWEKSNLWFQMRLWTQARVMGAFAAKCMISEMQHLDICFDLFTHVTKFFGYKVVLLGLFNGQTLENNYEIILRITPGKEYIKTVMKNGRMVGAILIGETDLEETFENLILNELDLSKFGEDLLNPDIDIEDYFD